MQDHMIRPDVAPHEQQRKCEAPENNSENPQRKDQRRFLSLRLLPAFGALKSGTDHIGNDHGDHRQDSGGLLEKEAHPACDSRKKKVSAPAMLAMPERQE